MTVAEAAEQIGCARQYLYMLDEGRPAGKRVAARIEAWSGGEIRATELMQMDKYKKQ